MIYGTVRNLVPSDLDPVRCNRRRLYTKVYEVLTTNEVRKG